MPPEKNTKIALTLKCHQNLITYRGTTTHIPTKLHQLQSAVFHFLPAHTCTDRCYQKQYSDFQPCWHER